MKQAVSIMWFRLDLRRTDNPALAAAARRGRAVIPVFIWASGEEGAWPPGAASRWWLHHSLQSLAADLGGLVIRRGPSLHVLRQLVKETGATAIFWNRRYEPALIARDTRVKQALLADGLQVESFNSALLFEPWEIKNGNDKPYRVFTPFWRACLKKEIAPAPKTRSLILARRWPDSLPLDKLDLLPKLDWAAGLRARTIHLRSSQNGSGKGVERKTGEAASVFSSEPVSSAPAGPSVFKDMCPLPV